MFLDDLPGCGLLHQADTSGFMLLLDPEGVDNEVLRHLSSHPSVFPLR
jgi:hypothetical protein